MLRTRNLSSVSNETLFSISNYRMEGSSEFPSPEHTTSKALPPLPLSPPLPPPLETPPHPPLLQPTKRALIKICLPPRLNGFAFELEYLAFLGDLTQMSDIYF